MPLMMSLLPSVNNKFRPSFYQFLLMVPGSDTLVFRVAVVHHSATVKVIKGHGLKVGHFFFCALGG
jgi:hypothetical protein